MRCAQRGAHDLAQGMHVVHASQEGVNNLSLLTLGFYRRAAFFEKKSASCVDMERHRPYLPLTQNE
jgi:hypothetical protein